MKISDNGRQFIKGWEGEKLVSYKDRGGVWTGGVGHTGPDVKPNTVITQEQSDAWFDADLEEHDIGHLLVGCETSQNQYDAMCSLAFNIGVEPFRNSTVLKRHKLGNKMGAANAFLLWHYDNGRAVRGLMRRREAERKLYLA